MYYLIAILIVVVGILGYFAYREMGNFIRGEQKDGQFIATITVNDEYPESKIYAEVNGVPIYDESGRPLHKGENKVPLPVDLKEGEVLRVYAECGEKRMLTEAFWIEEDGVFMSASQLAFEYEQNRDLPFAE